MVKRLTIGGLLVLLLTLQGARPEAAGTIYYVSKGTYGNVGDDTRSCATASNILTPKLTTESAVGCLSPDDTLYFRGGLYTDYSDTIDSTHYTVPSGTAGHPITFKSYPGETATIQHQDGTAGIQLTGPTIRSYLIFQDLVVDGINGTNTGISAIIYVSQGQNHIQFLNVEAKNAWVSGYNLYASGTNSPFNSVIGGSSHDNGRSGVVGGSAIGGGSNYGYGFYLDTTDTLIDGVEVYNNGGYGIQNIGDRNVIRNNFVHDNGTWGGTNYGIDNGASIYPSNDGVQIYNNIIVRNRGGILNYSNSSNTLIANNTIVANGPAGEAVGIEFTNGPTTVRNNILYLNTTNSVVDRGGNPVGGITQDHNFVPTTSPFVNISGDDYHLMAASAPLDTGTTVAAVTVDRDGVSRPQNLVYDPGAYERAVMGGSPPIIYTTSLQVGQKTVAYTDFACASGGTPPYLWDNPSGSLPTGMTQGSTTFPCTTISGTPTAAGTFTPSLRVTDSAALTATTAFPMMIYDVSPCTWSSGSWTAIGCGGGSSGTNGTSSAVATITTTTGANLIACTVTDDLSQTATPFADNKSNTYTLAGTAITAEYARVRLLWTKPGSVGATHTFTANPSGSPNFASVSCVAFSGGHATPLDQVGAGASGTAAAFLGTGSIVTTVNGALSLVALADERPNHVTLGSYSVFERMYSYNSAFGSALAWTVIATPSTSSSTWTWDNAMSSATYPASFKPASATLTGGNFLLLGVGR